MALPHAGRTHEEKGVGRLWLRCAVPSPPQPPRHTPSLFLPQYTFALHGTPQRNGGGEEGREEGHTRPSHRGQREASAHPRLKPAGCGRAMHHDTHLSFRTLFNTPPPPLLPCCWIDINYSWYSCSYSSAMPAGMAPAERRTVQQKQHKAGATRGQKRRERGGNRLKGPGKGGPMLPHSVATPHPTMPCLQWEEGLLSPLPAIQDASTHYPHPTLRYL